MTKRKQSVINDTNGNEHQITSKKPKKAILKHTYKSLSFANRKYWYQRYRLFSRFDEGILMDEESWYSVTPEPIAIQIAAEVDACQAKIIVDGFCGAGGNSIAFAREADLVYAWDIDPVKIECAKNNAKIYGVADRIHFQVGNFFDLIHTVEASCVFLSPPWGGPSYNTQDVFDVGTMQPYSATELLRAARKITNNVVLYLPRQSSQKQIAALQPPPGRVELQYLRCTGSLKALCCYFGDLASPVDADTEHALKGGTIYDELDRAQDVTLELL